MLGGVAIALGASAVALHPVAALGIALRIAAIAWVLSNALNATLAFIVVLVLRPADHFPALASMQPAKLVGLVAILSWLITKLLQGDTRVSLATHGKWMLALAVGLALSSTMSTDPQPRAVHGRACARRHSRAALGSRDGRGQSGVRKVAHNPLFGVGQFPENYQSYARNPVHWEARDAHNSFVKAAAETGFVGFIPFMALVLSWRSCY